MDTITDTVTRIATSYGMGYDDVDSVFCHYWSKGMTSDKALYYTQLACAALAGQTCI